MKLHSVIILILAGIVARIFGQNPQVALQSVNTSTVGLYEKFEINAGLTNVSWTNPYDPQQVDLRAVFTAPSGRVWEIFGFYDNYNGADQWKVRFAPNETGTWNYYLTLSSTSGAAQSTEHSFEAVASDYHGWIRVSPLNRHYFIHDDGTPFYGVGPYYPWNVNNTSNGLAKLQASGCNFWGYWNIMYDTGEIIESMNSGLGRYDQPKCGRIDQLINWSEERDLKMMLAIWPHDLLSNTVWAHQWHQNPYNTVTAVEDFFSSEEAWAWQEKQYRYIIARWGYSRALGVWEIVNEINGTDGWVAGKQDEARRWVGRVHHYLTANDPHQRPTTASVSGGQYWPEGYAEVDVPNVHMYETGWLSHYPGNPLRSSAYTYYKVANQLWNDFDKPAIFGEAGYTNSYGNFAAGSAEYTAMFHNALWAGWAGGLAATPLWWSFTSRQLMTDDVMEQMLRFSQIVRTRNHAWQDFQPYEPSADGCDVYALRSDSSIFGWLREAYGRPVRDHILQFPALEDTSYQIIWFDTWAAREIGRDFLIGADSSATVTVPASAGDIPDAAFFVSKTAEGDTPVRLQLSSARRKLYVRRGETARILCTVHDEQGRFVRSSATGLRFRIEGPGRFLGPPQAMTVEGRVVMTFTADSVAGPAAIIVESSGLTGDTLIIEVSNRIGLDDFEGFRSQTDLEYVWFVRSGTSAHLSLGPALGSTTGHSLKIDYAIGNGQPPYAGVFRLNEQDFSAAAWMALRLQGDGSGRTLALLINERSGRYWRYDHVLSDNQAQLLTIPLTEFVPGDTAGTIQLKSIDEISFNILAGEAGPGGGSIYLDDIEFVIPAIETAIKNKNNGTVPSAFVLEQNYPNPFNGTTTIRYNLPRTGPVTFEIYDTTGRVVDRLLKNTFRLAGPHQIRWQNQHLASGIYFYRLRAGQFDQVKKCILVK